MNTRIWRLAGVSLLALSISAQVLADDNNQQQQQQQQRQQQQRSDQQHQQQQQGQERQQQQVQQRQNQDRQQEQRFQQQRQQEQQQQNRQIQENQQDRFNQQRQQQERERGFQNDNQRRDQAEQQQRQQQQRQEQQQQQQREQQEQRQLQNRQGSLPLQSRPNEVWQTEQPRRGNYQDLPRDQRPDNRGWQGRPEGHGNGWGSGPRYNPGFQVDRMPGGYSRVPYRGQDYFYSGGYWYRPQGPRYIVVEPPRGVRVRYLPDYAQQVWLGSAMFFLAAGTYYSYEQSTQEYVVATPPPGVEPVYSPEQAPQLQPPPMQQQQQQQANPYDVAAYPNNGQGPDQVQQDHYDCTNYAVQQSNFNPPTATYAPAPEVLNAYQQAMAACYTGRGYVVQ